MLRQDFGEHAFLSDMFVPKSAANVQEDLPTAGRPKVYIISRKHRLKINVGISCGTY